MDDECLGNNVLCCLNNDTYIKYGMEGWGGRRKEKSTDKKWLSPLSRHFAQSLAMLTCTFPNPPKFQIFRFFSPAIDFFPSTIFSPLLTTFYAMILQIHLPETFAQHRIKKNFNFDVNNSGFYSGILFDSAGLSSMDKNILATPLFIYFSLSTTAFQAF